MQNRNTQANNVFLSFSEVLVQIFNNRNQLGKVKTARIKVTDGRDVFDDCFLVIWQLSH